MKTLVITATFLLCCSPGSGVAAGGVKGLFATVHKIRTARQTYHNQLNRVRAQVKLWRDAPAASQALDHFFGRMQDVISDAGWFRLLDFELKYRKVDANKVLYRPTLAKAHVVSLRNRKSGASARISISKHAAFAAAKWRDERRLEYHGRVDGDKLVDYVTNYAPHLFNRAIADAPEKARSMQYSAAGKTADALSSGKLVFYDEKGNVLSTTTAERGDFLKILREVAAP